MSTYYVTKYLVRTAAYRVIRRGFKTQAGAEGWAIDHFCVDWELDGGWVVEPYLEEV